MGYVAFTNARFRKLSFISRVSLGSFLYFSFLQEDQGQRMWDAAPRETIYTPEEAEFASRGTSEGSRDEDDTADDTAQGEEEDWSEEDEEDTYIDGEGGGTGENSDIGPDEWRVHPDTDEVRQVQNQPFEIVAYAKQHSVVCVFAQPCQMQQFEKSFGSAARQKWNASLELR